ncbi:MAG: DUF4468 domain-containing protein [Bacteroidaceae bacterium]|nr:DUF4468 domain-containing protein [Bacteroidaceae bacterium]MBR5147782.1 DUF4468 domain-containing protein [Bacteroidaceae bacterium]
MKRFLLTICLGLSLMSGWAQVEAKYDKGSVPVVNGRILFQETIPTTLTEEEAYARIAEWAQERFNKPNVIISKFIENDAVNHRMSFTAEEYIVFKNKFFVLDRTRINYWMEIICNEGQATVKLTRINYWYEEERDGGLKFSAEEMITDEEAFNKKGTQLLKDQGKFRCKTIDFFEANVVKISELLAQ